jgi:hypothetical protein
LVYAGTEVSNVNVQNGTIKSFNYCIDEEVTDNGTNPNASGQVHDVTFKNLTLSTVSGGGEIMFLGAVYNISIINCSFFGGFNGIDDRDFGGDHFVSCVFSNQNNYGLAFRGSIDHMNTTLSLPTQTTP